MPTNQIRSFQLQSCSHQHQMNKIKLSLRQFFGVSLCVAISLCALLFIPINLVNAHSLADNSILDGASNNQLQQQPLQHQQHNPRHQANKLLQTSHLSGSQNRCQSGWMWFNNKCWVTTQSRRDFTHAIELCKKMYNSTLPTIHSEDENEFLRQNIDLHNSPIWLFARHNHQYNKTRWLDKTTVNYTRWDVGQPSEKSSLVCIKTEDSWYMKKAEAVDGQTECVSFWEDAKWGTQVGCLVLLPVVCEKKLTPINRYSENLNGTITSQYEQQQMIPGNVAGASSPRSTTLSPNLFFSTIFATAILLTQQLSITPKLSYLPLNDIRKHNDMLQV